MAWEFEQIAGPFKGPVGGLAWDGEGLLFSLIHESRILRYDPRNGDVSLFRKYTWRTNGLAFSAEGYLYGCQSGARRIVRYNSDGSASPTQQRLGGKVENHPNDLVFDSKGRTWFTDPYSPIPMDGPQLHGPLEHASVLRMSHLQDLWVLKRMTYDTRAPRGVLLSQDERTLYVSEGEEEPEGKRELRAYPILDDGTLGPYVTLATFGSDHRGVHRGVEGMCLDAEGNLLACAGWRKSGPGPAIYVFSPTGQVLETHPVPADQPMSCTFGDPDLGTLYLSTGEGINSGEGYLFRVRNTGRKGWLLYPKAG